MLILRMAFSTAYIYKKRSSFNINPFIQVLRFIIINAILAFVFLFLALEEIDWALFSSRENINDKIIDNTSWNIKDILSLLKF